MTTQTDVFGTRKSSRTSREIRKRQDLDSKTCDEARGKGNDIISGFDRITVTQII